MSVEAYPLHWPEGWQRTRTPKRSFFKTGFGTARNLLLAELTRMGATCVVLSTNLPLRNDGMPRASAKVERNDQGCAVYFERKGKAVVFACDQYDRLHDNIHAIAKTLDAMRGIERWGASDMLERAFTGFKALAATSGSGEDPWRVLGIPRTATRQQIGDAFRSLARTAHPDTGGSADQMARINLARTRCLDALEGASTP